MFKRIAAATIALVMLSACTPSKQYEGSKSDGAFFTVPNGWQKVDGTALNKVEAKNANQDELDRLSMVTYQAGFTKAKKIDPKDIFLLEPTKDPVLYVRIRDLFPEERNAISLNTLRNLVLPITDYLDGTIPNDRKFELYDDQEINEVGGRGVSLLYSFDYNGVNETVNQVALMSNDQNKIYVFIIRCSTECYNKNIDEIDEIVNSFTVKGAK
ncbi:MAG: hypothetical protein FGM48_01095 [Candidatus Nanopelagicaceae bacterium]|jgi:hypothetical protein|nr:hypothetical protein [Candidatus Nanopelagicaceae bacterium]